MLICGHPLFLCVVFFSLCINNYCKSPCSVALGRLLLLGRVLLKAALNLGLLVVAALFILWYPEPWLFLNGDWSLGDRRCLHTAAPCLGAGMVLGTFCPCSGFLWCFMLIPKNPTSSLPFLPLIFCFSILHWNTWENETLQACSYCISYSSPTPVTIGTS